MPNGLRRHRTLHFLAASRRTLTSRFTSVVGATVGHEWCLAAAPDNVAGDVVSVGGPALHGEVAVLVGLALCVVLGLTARQWGRGAD